MSGGKWIRVLIVDDYPIYARGLVACLSAMAEITCVGMASSGPDVLEAIDRLHPDVVILDVFPPGTTMSSLARRIRNRFPLVALVALVDTNMDLVALALIREGANGCLSRSCESSELETAVRITAAGECFVTPSIASTLIRQFRRLGETPGRAGTQGDGLTERELTVLDLMARGKSNRAIATFLGLSERTIENHARSIYGKLHVHDRTQAVLTAQEKGHLRLLAPEEQTDGHPFIKSSS